MSRVYLNGETLRCHIHTVNLIGEPLAGLVECADLGKRAKQKHTAKWPAWI